MDVDAAPEVAGADLRRALLQGADRPGHAAGDDQCDQGRRDEAKGQ